MVLLCVCFVCVCVGDKYLVFTHGSSVAATEKCVVVASVVETILHDDALVVLDTRGGCAIRFWCGLGSHGCSSD